MACTHFQEAKKNIKAIQAAKAQRDKLKEAQEARKRKLPAYKGEQQPICCKRICCCGGIDTAILQDCRTRYLDCKNQAERKAFLLKMRDINSPTNFAGLQSQLQS